LLTETIFRAYRQSEAERSDRTAGDRLRHRQKVRESIRENIADIIAEEPIIGKDRDKIIKVPLRGIKEYRFIYGDNARGVSEGTGEEEPGQVIATGIAERQKSGSKAGDRPGVDYYETDVTLEELIEIMFEDLELPNMERKALRETVAEWQFKRKGYRKKGIRVRLDKRRTVISKVRRKQATRPSLETRRQEDRFPFHNDDLTYRHTVTDLRPQSNAVVLCIMDTSGSMDTIKKYLARSFFFLLYQFLSTKYQNVEIVFISHHTEAREVSEEEFFRKGESGGTFISSGYLKALEIVHERYHPSLWNIYVFHCSDGDNFDSDNPRALKAAKELTDISNLFGYAEIKPMGAGYYGNSMIHVFSRLNLEHFHAIQIERKEDIWPSFTAILAKDRAKEN
jgi:sporulation protein YhbH